MSSVFSIDQAPVCAPLGSIGVLGVDHRSSFGSDASLIDRLKSNTQIKVVTSTDLGILPEIVGRVAWSESLFDVVVGTSESGISCVSGISFLDSSSKSSLQSSDGC